MFLLEGFRPLTSEPKSAIFESSIEYFVGVVSNSAICAGTTEVAT